MTYDIGVFTRRRIISPAESYFAVPAVGTSGGGAYSGPGDVAAGALFWVGLRAYSAAAIGQSAVTLVYNDTTPITYATIAGGGLPISTITADSVTHGTPIRISTLHDQTGNGHNFTMTGSNRPTFTLGGLGLFPVITFDGISLLTGMVNTSGITSGISTPYSVSWAALNSFAGGLQSVMLTDNANFNIGYNVSNTANNVSLYNGAANPTVTASDGAYHSVHLLMHSTAASSIIQIDYPTPTTVNPGSSAAFASAHEISIGCFSTSGTPSSFLFDGKLLELGVWASDTSTNFTAIAQQQKLYWGWP